MLGTLDRKNKSVLRVGKYRPPKYRPPKYRPPKYRPPKAAIKLNKRNFVK